MKASEVAPGDVLYQADLDRIDTWNDAETFTLEDVTHRQIVVETDRDVYALISAHVQTKDDRSMGTVFLWEPNDQGEWVGVARTMREALLLQAQDSEEWANRYLIVARRMREMAATL